ncbi:DUF2971 domain-containing protein [Variovorax sp. PvP013]|uniref:DUF2971 domain-containing protein n=1 Tax=Variovorax sp. PvP013 TaxID=3156435 RepID=UPI003D1F9765
MSQIDLASLNYEPGADEKLYHYCPATSFWAILNSRTFWLSAIHSLNDSSELQWGRTLAARVLADDIIEFKADFRFAVHSTFSSADKNVLPVVFSLSRNGDLLSQWRAYAGDADGFALELDATRLQTASAVNMKTVLYDQREQEALVRYSLQSFANWWRRDEKAAKMAVMEVLPSFAMDLLSLKHPSFYEEQEVRMVRLLVRDGSSFVDPGGTLASGPAPALPIHSRSSRGIEAPYIALPIDMADLVTGIVLGPKNSMLPHEVNAKLAECGLPRVRVWKSTSPYR